MNEKELATFIARLPDHLRFFFEQPPKGLEAEELLAFSRERISKVRQHREELIAHGIKADDFLKGAEEVTRPLAEAQGKVEKLEDELLHARANAADAEYALFRVCKETVSAMEEVKPFDSEVQELREEVDEWSKHFPKE